MIKDSKGKDISKFFYVGVKEAILLNEKRKIETEQDELNKVSSELDGELLDNIEAIKKDPWSLLMTINGVSLEINSLLYQLVVEALGTNKIPKSIKDKIVLLEELTKEYIDKTENKE